MTSADVRSLVVMPHTLGSTLAVTVTPRSSRNQLEQLSDGSLRVRITAPPVDGAANAILLKFLADLLAVPHTHLTIASGETGRQKRILATGIHPEQLVRCIEQAISKGS